MSKVPPDSTNLRDCDLSHDRFLKDRGCLLVIQGGMVGERFPLDTNKKTLGRVPGVEIEIRDDSISRRHAEIAKRDNQFFIRDLGSTNGTFVNGEKISSERQLRSGDAIVLGGNTVLRFELQDELDERAHQEMYQASLLDGLTKIYNRKYFQDRLVSEFAFAVRHGSPLHLLMIDVDHFKQINDTHGHVGGDAALTALVAVIGKTIRHEDVFARYGGEEFALICRGVNEQGAHAFSERVRRAVETCPLTHAGKSIQLTVSIGLAKLMSTTMGAPEALIVAADDALYQAKREGRNRTVVASPFIDSQPTSRIRIPTLTRP